MIHLSLREKKIKKKSLPISQRINDREYILEKDVSQNHIWHEKTSEMERDVEGEMTS